MHSHRHSRTQTHSNTTVLQQSVILIIVHSRRHRAHRQTVTQPCYTSQSYINTCWYTHRHTQTHCNTTVLQHSVIHKHLQTSLCTHRDILAHRHAVILPCYNSQWHINVCRHHYALVHTQTHTQTQSNTTVLQHSVIHKHLQTSLCTSTHTDTHTDRHAVIPTCYKTQWYINTCRHHCALTQTYTHTDTQ